jgi:hypothetical protein
MVAGTSNVSFRGCVHEHVWPSERLRSEWVQGCSCPHQVCTPNESDWTEREQEQIGRHYRVFRVGKAQMSGGLEQGRCARYFECAGAIGVVLSTAVVEYGC